MDDRHRRVLELCNGIARDKTLAWLEDSVAEIRWKAGGKERDQVKDGLVVAVFQHYESRATESRPLLHAHAAVSIRARRPHDGKWGNLTAYSLMTHIVAADTLYTLYFMEEVSARLGWAWEPREVTSGRGPVMDIAGIDRRLIGWQSTRRQQIEDALSVLTDKYEERQGYAPGEKASFPGLGPILGARVLAELGDDRARFTDARALESYAGSAPITRASGKKRFVGRRFVKNNRLINAGFLWAFAALTASPGANAHYRRRRDHGDWHAAAQRHLLNRYLGQLHNCLKTRQFFDEQHAFAPMALPPEASNAQT
ncbi:hypothetical protein J2S50_000019 [Streptomyces sp. DSM 40167]|nr:hypothetical protein [Streptomyces sp. DSM 40167]